MDAFLYHFLNHRLNHLFVSSNFLKQKLPKYLHMSKKSSTFAVAKDVKQKNKEHGRCIESRSLYYFHSESGQKTMQKAK
jgi:hypothetical protein